MGRIVKCAFCEQQMDKDNSIRYNNKNYHEQCLYLYKEKEKLTNYICELFNLKSPGPRNYTLIKKYCNENNFTYYGMRKSLEYFYKIKGNSLDKANNSIGIIPYIYEEAKDYFYKIEKKKEKFEDLVKKQDNFQTTQLILKVKTRNKNKSYNLELLGGEENNDNG